MAAREWTDTLLDELLTATDPTADAVAAAVLADGRLDAINALMRSLTHNAEPVPAELPPPVIDYFERTAALPPWADPARIDAGEALFVRYGLPALQGLMLRALPECYAMPAGAEILIQTGRLDHLTRQRVLETVHFTVDVMVPGGLGPEGRGIRSAQRVRLLHAAIRTHLRAAGWAPAGRQPINQLEMVATLGSFSALIVDSLRRFGVDLTAEEEGAYIHCWNVVGYIMGVREDLLFHDLDDGLALWRRVRERERGRSPAGSALAGALLDFANGLVPGRLFDGINATMLRHLCGDELADLLDVPPSNWTRFFLGRYRRLVAAGDAFQDLGPFARWIVRRISHTMITSLIGRGRAGERPSFDIPAELRAGWKL
ncbi:MAG: DUF2236 domain-containing protein, partial [Myxococcales bacterium]|nr:DUF2236 domain-containing protein [Myxococcales bacterium]